MSKSVVSALRELVESDVLSDEDAASVSALADRLDSAGPPSVSDGPVGSDLSVFIKNISILGFAKAFVQFVKDVFNVKD
jgi:hypothetical protein